MYPIIDTHTHCYFPAIEKDQAAIFRKCEEAGVKIQVQIGCDEISSLAALSLAQKFKGHYATLGLHPCDVKNVGIKNEEYHRYKGFEAYDLKATNFEQLFALFTDIYEKNKDHIVGFGETGFDLFHENSEEILALQKTAFRQHLNLCETYQKPIIIHTREAREVTLNFLEKEMPNRKNIRGVIHCFSEDAGFAEIVTKQYGFFLGIGGVLTYNKTEAIREAVKKTPIEYLVTETDSPFLVPRKAKNKKQRINYPGLLPEVIELIADIKNIDPDTCGHILFENGKRLFNLA